MNSIYSDFCYAFCGKRQPTISNIKEHPFLQKYFKIFSHEEKNFTSGIFVIDPLGIYTPVQDNFNGVVCFRKLPFNNKTVFSLHDGFQTELMVKDNFYFLFPGVIKTENFGFKFIDDFSLFPASAIISTNSENYVTFKSGLINNSSKQEESSSDEDFTPVYENLRKPKYEDSDDE